MSRHFPVSAVLALLVLGAPTVPLAASSTQLSAGHPFSDISFTTTRPQFSPNGQFAVYRQDAVVDGAVELWSVRVSGGSPVLLSNVLTPAQGQFMTFAISPNSTRVVYAVDQDTTGKYELFSVPIGGGAVTKLNLNLASDRDVIEFRISPTSDRVIYSADAEGWTSYGLYSVPIAGPGGASVQLNPPISSDTDVDGFEISPDGATVVYRIGRHATSVWNLYSVPAIGGEPVRLNGGLPSRGTVGRFFLVTPNGNRVLYLADTTGDGTLDLYSAPIAGGSLEKVSSGVAAGYSIDPSFIVSRDSERVVFRGATVAAQAFDLFSAPAGGGTVVRLNGELQSNEDVEAGFSVSANNARVVYRSDEDVNDVIDVYSVPITGGTPTRLNGALAPGGDVLDLAISPNSARVVYLADQATDTLNELWSVPITGGSVTKLNRALASGGDVQAYLISPNSSWVVYGADQDADTVDELMRVPIAGGTVQTVNGPLIGGGDVILKYVQSTVFEISPANSFDVLYAADQVVNDQIELFLSGVPGTSPPGPPTAVFATAGDAQATVTFVAPASSGSSAITGYTVTSNPPGGTDSNDGSTALSHLVTGLTNGTPYAFTVTATNNTGTGASSLPSNTVTPTPPSACPANASTLCLHGGKFAVNVDWRNFADHTGQGQASALSSQSGDFWFFNSASNEMIVKVINACASTGRYWIFWRALSNVEMDLVIRDTETLQTLSYHNPLGFSPNGHLDIDTIFHCDGTGPASRTYDTSTDLPAPGIPQLVEAQDPTLISPCVPDGDRAICLQGSRFRIRGTWRDFQGNSGDVHLIKKNNGSGYGWFFSSNNYELLFKIIDGCSFNGNFWVSVAGLTNVETTFTIEDSWTGALYRQVNALGVDFPTDLDIDTNLTYCGPAPN